MPRDRRHFLKSAALATIAAPAVWIGPRAAAESANERPVFAIVGCGGKGRDDTSLAMQWADLAIVCDVDQQHAASYASNPRFHDQKGRKLDSVDDYRRVLDRNDVDVVVCATPDHWHTKIFAEALAAGKHVYGEKPMTLTIDEVKLLRRVASSTDRVFQVGNQQRSCQWFREAVAMARSGVLGENLVATCDLGPGRSGGPFASEPVPEGLDWDRWLGQAPMTPYIPQRCHGTFRWWFEYSGGKLTDWGAHHIDIALWAINAFEQGPIAVEGTGLMDGRPDCYNTAQTFDCTLTFPGGRKIVVRDGGRANGIMFDGGREHIYVNRGRMTGNLVDQMLADADWRQRTRAAADALYPNGPVFEDEDLSPESYAKLSADGRWTRVKRSHMGDFFRCIRENKRPISDVDSVGLSTICCHLCNIAMRLGRPLRWDPEAEHFVDDAEANAMLERTPRNGYEVDV